MIAPPWRVRILTGCLKLRTFQPTFFWWGGGDGKEPQFSPAPVLEPFPSPGWRCWWRPVTTPSGRRGGAAPGQKTWRGGWLLPCLRGTAYRCLLQGGVGKCKGHRVRGLPDSQARRKRETVSAFALCTWSFEKRWWHRGEKDSLRAVLQQEV